MLHLIPPPIHRQAYRIADRLRKIWWRVAKPQLIGVAVIATDLEGQLLLIRLSYGSGGWNLPTGGVQRGEDVIDAAKRELAEETGCEGHSVTLLSVQQDVLHGAQNSVHVYTAKVTGHPSADMREVIEARFFPAHSLPEPLTPATQRRLALWRKSLKQG